jgi:hypothetical protein
MTMNVCVYVCVCVCVRTAVYMLRCDMATTGHTLHQQGVSSIPANHLVSGMHRVRTLHGFVIHVCA